ncbi:MAG: hypothetical protein JSS27_03920 [Planctomycetes bacterium]|nr:hypothetical protein [Planctomycetota bacterium]
MDFLNKSFAQVADLFRQMTPASRFMAALLLIGVVVSLGYLFSHTSSGGDIYLLGGQSFSASEISAMEAAFGKAKLSGYSLDGTRLRIPRGQQAAYMAALADNGALPAHFGDYLTDATMKVSQFTSRAQQDEMIKTAKQRELALIIRSMSGVEKAAVHYDTQKRGGLRGTPVTTASVSVKPAGPQPLDERQVPMIRHLVAGAIAGLSPDAVTVVDLNGRTYSGNSHGSGPGSASEDPYLARVKEYQAMYEQMIAHALSYVPGATITAQVELDRELLHRTEKNTYDPKGSVPLQTREETGNSTQEGGGPGGRPGFEGQQAANQAARLVPGAGGPKSTDEKTTTETTNAVSNEILKVDRAPLTPRRVTASVAVPSSYFESVWRRRNPAAAGQAAKEPDQAALEAIQREETEKIRQHVEKILPPPVTTAGAADATAPLVTVTTFLNVPASAIAEPNTADQMLVWLGNWWNTIALVALVGFSLLMLRSLLKSVPQQRTEPPTAVTAAFPQEPEQAEEPEEKAKSRLKRRVSGPSLREELVDLVREDPDAAANILRSWIGNAS